MKRIFILFLSLVLCIGIVGCTPADKVKAWTEADFSFYDENGTEVAFPASEETIYLEDINEEKGGDFQTLRGVKIGMRATTALEPYDNVFYWFIMRGRSSTPEEEALREKYPDIHDLVAASPDFLHSDEYLVINTIFHVSEDGSMIPCQMKDGLCDDEMEIGMLEYYDLSFDISNEKITSVRIEHYPSFLDTYY